MIVEFEKHKAQKAADGLDVIRQNLEAAACEAPLGSLLAALIEHMRLRVIAANDNRKPHK